ncbi:MAG: D-aminoacyl-tRNA deacylase [Candidatus Fimadaptatus sp.]|jgi:D-tyrosyl-tRNA(Tyr) deacylase
MRCVVQRCTRAQVSVDGEVVGRIGAGFMVLCGVESGDSQADMEYCRAKIAGLRVFEDDDGKMNLSLCDVGGEILLVSQFTLLGDARHGRRPSFSNAAAPDDADALYRKLVEALRADGFRVETGRFQTHMQVELVNDGPVTILLDSKKGF